MNWIRLLCVCVLKKNVCANSMDFFRMQVNKWHLYIRTWVSICTSSNWPVVATVLNLQFGLCCFLILIKHEVISSHRSLTSQTTFSLAIFHRLHPRSCPITLVGFFFFAMLDSPYFAITRRTNTFRIVENKATAKSTHTLKLTHSSKSCYPNES